MPRTFHANGQENLSRRCWDEERAQRVTRSSGAALPSHSPQKLARIDPAPERRRYNYRWAAGDAGECDNSGHPRESPRSAEAAATAPARGLPRAALSGGCGPCPPAAEARVRFLRQALVLRAPGLADPRAQCGARVTSARGPESPGGGRLDSASAGGDAAAPSLRTGSPPFFLAWSGPRGRGAEDKPRPVSLAARRAPAAVAARAPPANRAREGVRAREACRGGSGGACPSPLPPRPPRTRPQSRRRCRCGGTRRREGRGPHSPPRPARPRRGFWVPARPCPVGPGVRWVPVGRVVPRGPGGPWASAALHPDRPSRGAGLLGGAGRRDAQPRGELGGPGGAPM